jgi:hypothetical protein
MSCEPCFGGVDRPHVVELYRRNAAVAKPFRTLWISATHGRLAVADLTDQAIATILIYSGHIGPVGGLMRQIFAHGPSQYTLRPENSKAWEIPSATIWTCIC